LDLRQLFPANCEVIFDVGAHLGNLTETFRRIAPLARVYAFEPFPSFYSRLAARFQDDTRISVFPFGMSDMNGEKQLFVHNMSLSVVSPLISGGAYPTDAAASETIRIQTRTLDHTSEELLGARPHIDLLKVDVEGHDLQVLQGAQNLLKGGTIEAIFVEVMFIEHFKNAPLFLEILSYLQAFGYRLFSMYGVKKNDTGQWRFGNALVLSPNRQKFAGVPR
jgi:FkbM family methyltransferase